MKSYLYSISQITVLIILCFNLLFALETKIIAPDAVTDAQFGTAVAIEGDLLVITAQKDNSRRGSIYIFRRIGSEWNFEKKISGPYQGARFGNSVSLCGNKVVVGCEKFDSDRGAVFVYTFTGTDWLLEQVLQASESEIGARFGSSVSIDDQTIVVGSWWKDQTSMPDMGEAYIFYFREDTWNEVARLIASDVNNVIAGQNNIELPGDLFGSSVSIKGEYAIVGAPQNYGDNNVGRPGGAAYVFYRNQGGPDNWGEQIRIIPNQGGTSFLGCSVSLSGDYAAIGAYGDTDFSQSYVDNGAIYLYHRSGVSWDLDQKIYADAPVTRERIGWSVSLSGEYLIAGTPLIINPEEPEPPDAVYSFLHTGSSWGEVSKIEASDNTLGDWFGCAVSIDNDHAIVGAMLDDHSGLTDAGSAYVYETINDLSLPVELNLFTARCENNSILIEWATQSEVNNLGFEISRFNPELNQFTTISSYLYNDALKSQGNSNSQHHYSYIDQDISSEHIYQYKLTDIDLNGKRTEHGPVEVIVPALSWEYVLYPAFPNPFNPTTTLRFTIPHGGKEKSITNLSIYNILGERITTLFNGQIAPGSYEYHWKGETDNGTAVSGGVYFAVFNSGIHRQIQKLVYTK